MNYSLLSAIFSQGLSDNVRQLLAFLTSLFMVLCLGKPFILWAAKRGGAISRSIMPITHQEKNGIPTAGGLLIIGVMVVNLLCWSDLKSPYLWVELWVLLGFCFLGALDDWFKIRSKIGITALSKFSGQLFLACSTVAMILFFTLVDPVIYVPFSLGAIGSGVLFFVWASFIIIGCSNAVNLTDGLDGLAVNVLLPNFFVLALLAVHFSGDMVFAQVGLASAIAGGALLGFLWFNSYPAQLFMGDSGSLALGAFLALLVIFVRYEWFLVISGVVLVVETLSVILQIGSFRLRGKKLFRMAPIHHHFELAGLSEQKITARATIISWALSLLAYALYVALS